MTTQTGNDAAALARTIYDNFSRGALEANLALATEDVIVELVPFGTTFRGRQGFMDFMQGFRTAFPDCSLHLTGQVAAGDRVVSEFRAKGTHKGPLVSPAGEVPPTGKSIDYEAVEVWRIRDGKLAHLRNYFDSATMLRQLGLPA